MGDYSQVIVAMRLNDLTTNEIEIIEHMLDAGTEQPKTLPDHPFFKTRWDRLFSNTAYYLPVHSSVGSLTRDSHSGDWQLAVIGGIKWSAEEEMSLFIDWIKPRIEAHYSNGEKTFVGLTRYECDEDPKLYYVENKYE